MRQQNAFVRFIVRNWHATVFLCLLLGVGGYYARMAFSGRTPFRDGDFSQRILISFDYANDLAHNVFQAGFFNTTWGPGYFIMQALQIKLMRAVGLDTLSSQLLSLQLTSLLWWGLGILLISRAVASISDEFAASLAGIFLIGLPGLLTLAPTSMTEIYAFVLVALSLFLFTRRRATGPDLIWPAAVALLVATSVRSEVVSLGLPLAIVLAFRRRFVSALSFLVLSSAYVISKIAYVLIFERERKMTIFTYGKNYFWATDLAGFFRELLALIRLFIDLNGPYLLVILAMAVFAVAAMTMTNGDVRQRLTLASLRESFLGGLQGPQPVLFWALLLLGFAGFLSWLVLRGQANAQTRYTMFPGVFIVALLTTVSSICLARIHNATHSLRRATPLLIILFAGAISAYSVRRYSRDEVPPAADLQATITWLNRNNTQGAPLAFDFLGWWDQPLHLYTSSANRPLTSFSYSHYPPRKTPLPVELRNEDDPTLNGFREISTLHAFLADYRPAYVVLASQPFYAQLKEYTLIGYHLRASYLRPYLVERNGDEVLALNSPYLPANTGVVLTHMVTEGRFSIYAVTVTTAERRPGAPTGPPSDGH